MHTLAAAMFLNRGEVRLKSQLALVLHVTVPCFPMRQLCSNTHPPMHLFSHIMSSLHGWMQHPQRVAGDICLGADIKSDGSTLQRISQC